MKKKKRRIPILPFIILFLILFGVEYIFNISSNYIFYLNNESPLLLKTENGWTSIQGNEEKIEVQEIIKSEKINVSSFRINRKRPHLGPLNSLTSGKMMIFEFAPSNDFSILADAEEKFPALSCAEAMGRFDVNFMVNANFYGSKNQVMGELILDEKTYHKESQASGFFRVIDGKPYVGARSIFAEIPGKIEYSCQAFPSVINKGEIFPYVIEETKPSNKQWERKTYRNLIGMKPDGSIVFLLSNQRGILSIKEISLLAKSLGLDRASLFDGGVALQYKLESSEGNISFSAFNNAVDLGKRVDEYFMENHRMLFKQRSPVYIGVKLGT